MFQLLLYRQHYAIATLSKLLTKDLKDQFFLEKYKLIDNKIVEIAADNGEKYIR